MTKTILLGITLAVVFAVSMALTAYAFDKPYMTGLTDSVVNGPPVSTVTVSSSVSKIPAHTFDLAGFAWGLTGSGTGADLFAITTHHGVRDSTQRPNQWHAHNVDVTGGAGAAEFCIVDLQDNPFAKINVKQNTLTATLPTSSVSGTLVPGVIPADIIVEPACAITDIGGIPSGLRLGLDVV